MHRNRIIKPFRITKNLHNYGNKLQGKRKNIYIISIVFRKVDIPQHIGYNITSINFIKLKLICYKYEKIKLYK